MLVEACHTTILIIISVAHSKKSKGFFRLEIIGDPRWFPEELRQLIIIHKPRTQRASTKKHLRDFYCFVFLVRNPKLLK